MTTYTLPADGEYTFNDAYNYNDHCLNFQGVDGQVVITARPPGSSVFHSVPNGTVDIANPHMVRFTGNADEYRFVLTGASAPVTVTSSHTVHGQGINYRAVEATMEPILRSGPNGFERIRVDVGEPGFWYGRQFEMGYVFDIPNGTTRTIKIEYPVDAIILEAGVSVDTGSVFYRIYKGDDVTEATAFTTPILPYSLSRLSFTPTYTPVVQFSTGGSLNDLTNAPFQSPIRLRSANATAQQQSIGGGSNVQKGIPANSVSYIVLSQLAGTSGATTGVLRIKYEERTWGY